MTAESNSPACCPLCGQPNICAMELERATGQPQGPCWCTTTSFPKSLLDRVPPEKAGVACICAECVRKAVAAQD